MAVRAVIRELFSDGAHLLEMRRFEGW